MQGAPPPPGGPGYPPPPPPGYPPPGYPPPGYPPPQSPTKWGLVGGIMLLIGGLIALLYGAWMMYVITMADAVTGGLFFAMGGGALYACAAIPLIFGIIGLLGGIFAIQRKHWGLALVGAILVLISPGIIFGILGLIFVIMGKDEFQ